MGTVVKAGADVDPLGVVSVLPLATHGAHPAVQQTLAFLRRHCPAAQAPHLERVSPPLAGVRFLGRAV